MSLLKSYACVPAVPPRLYLYIDIGTEGEGHGHGHTDARLH